MKLAHKIDGTSMERPTFRKYDTFTILYMFVYVCVSVCVSAHSKRLHCPFSLFRASKFRVSFGR